MEYFDLYKDIATRTGGDIYIGVVGPVRTGKSTFIKRFMDEMVIPNIENDYSRERAKDELPQSATGTAVMTTEPKFVPNEAVSIILERNVNFRVRMIDCVGYLVPGATGYMDGNDQRMISTPWSEEKMPFEEAAEIGTKKVINEHSTIGVVITTDGSITEIPRDDYIEAEERVVHELRAIGKPFIMILNTLKPFALEVTELSAELSQKHGVPVVPLNCAQLKQEDINLLMEKVLYEFPLKELRIHLPKWIETLPYEHWLKKHIIDFVKDGLGHITRLRELRENIMGAHESDFIKKALVEKIVMGEGSADIEITVDSGLFYKVLSETTGMNIESDYQLISTIKVLSEAKREYDKVKYALEEVRQKGYGIVTPVLEEMRIEEPKLVKHGSKYGVKIKAAAPSIHIKSNKQELRVCSWRQVQPQGWKPLYIRGRGVFAGWVKCKGASRGEMACSFYTRLFRSGLIVSKMTFICSFIFLQSFPSYRVKQWSEQIFCKKEQPSKMISYNKAFSIDQLIGA